VNGIIPPHRAVQIPAYRIFGKARTPIYTANADTLDWVSHTNSGYSPGAWQRMVQRPCLAEDTVSGYLYCSMWWYDSIHVSQGTWPQGEAFVSVSNNRGRTWSVPTNVTQTIPRNQAPAGQCKSERDVSMHDRATYINDVGYLHMEYIYDLDAGACIQTNPAEGVATNNPVRYQRIPVDQIPLTPQWDYSFPALHVDSTGFPGRVQPLNPNDPNPIQCVIEGVNDHSFTASSFRLYQNYPNPFNPTTFIQFDLARNSHVTLKVFNVMGQEVATLYNNQLMSSGTKSISFDAGNLASGVYVYRINVEGVTASQKMVLMK